MEAGCVVNFRNFLEAGAFVRERTNPLQTVQSTRGQRLIEFAARDVLNGSTQFAQNLATKTGHTEFQTVEVSCRFDFIAEPATGLRTGVARQERFQVEDFAQLVVQLVAATMVVPVGQLLRSATEWYGCEIGISRVLTDEVVVSRVINVCLTGRHSVKHFKRADQLARCFLVDGQLPSDIALTMSSR